jgi:hypothetical protein
MATYLSPSTPPASCAARSSLAHRYSWNLARCNETSPNLSGVFGGQRCSSREESKNGEHHQETGNAKAGVAGSDPAGGTVQRRYLVLLNTTIHRLLIVCGRRSRRRLVRSAHVLRNYCGTVPTQVGHHLHGRTTHAVIRTVGHPCHVCDTVRDGQVGHDFPAAVS